MKLIALMITVTITCSVFSQSTSRARAIASIFNLKLPNEFYINDIRKENIPKRFDLRAYIPDIGDQKNEEKCSAFTAAYMKTIQYNFINKIDNSTSDFYLNSDSYIFDPDFIYYTAKCDNLHTATTESGIDLGAALGVIKSTGAVTTRVVKDVFRNQIDCRNIRDSNLLDIVKSFKSDDCFSNVPFTNNTVKKLLLKGTPVGIVAFVDNSFFDRGSNQAYVSGNSDYYWSGYYLPSPINYNALMSHSMLIVGYDDIKNAFLVLNSKGARWGNQGYFYLPYSFIDRQISMVIDGSVERIPPILKNIFYLLEPNPLNKYSEFSDLKYESDNIKESLIYNENSLVFKIRAGQYNKFLGLRFGCFKIDRDMKSITYGIYDGAGDSLIVKGLPMGIENSITMKLTNGFITIKLKSIEKKRVWGIPISTANISLQFVHKNNVDNLKIM